MRQRNSSSRDIESYQQDVTESSSSDHGFWGTVLLGRRISSNCMHKRISSRVTLAPTSKTSPNPRRPTTRRLGHSTTWSTTLAFLLPIGNSKQAVQGWTETFLWQRFPQRYVCRAVVSCCRFQLHVLLCGLSHPLFSLGLSFSFLSPFKLLSPPATVSASVSPVATTY
jgi:hypothetical protein